nr:MBL fold metallo-hydrolase [uncultured Psychroserpens sp.]
MTRKKLIFILPILYTIFAYQSQTANKISKSNSLLKHTTTQDTVGKNQLKIAYTGNMGVCIEHDDKTVIIDGLHQFYNKAYVFTPQEMANQLILGQFKDFTPIEFSLITHMHGDHFSGTYAKQYLESNPNGNVVGSSQINQDIVTFHKGDHINNRFNSVPYDKQPHIIEKQGIKITAIQCDHASPKRHGNTQNIAYLINMANFSILHVGDTEWNLMVQPMKTLDIKNKNLDIAILPYWMLLENNATEQINNQIAPKHIIATHIPPNFSEQKHKQLSSKFSNITLLTNLGEVHYFDK